LPWIPHPTRTWDHLPDLVHSLADAALTQSPGEADIRMLIATAMVHGNSRRNEGANLEEIFGDYYRLRTAMWEYLQERQIPANVATQAVLNIDRAITTATTASLLGYHERDIEADGGAVAESVNRLLWDLYSAASRFPFRPGPPA
jgi:hypothetical protein